MFRVVSSRGGSVERPILSLAAEGVAWLGMRLRGDSDGVVRVTGLVDGHAYAVAAYDMATGDVAIVRDWKPEQGETVLRVEPTTCLECVIQCPDGSSPRHVKVVCEPVVSGLGPQKHAYGDDGASIRVPEVAGALYDVTIRAEDGAGRVYLTRLPLSKLLGQRTFRLAIDDMR
jgi:hypothetical protein